MISKLTKQIYCDCSSDKSGNQWFECEWLKGGAIEVGDLHLLEDGVERGGTPASAVYDDLGTGAGAARRRRDDSEGSRFRIFHLLATYSPRVDMFPGSAMGTSIRTPGLPPDGIVTITHTRARAGLDLRKARAGGRSHRRDRA